MLTDLQNSLNSLNSPLSGENTVSAAEQSGTSLKDRLSAIDLTTATDEQVSDLFEEAVDAMEQALHKSNSDANESYM